MPKVFFFLLLPVGIASCCWGNRKCKQGDNSAKFRIVNSVNGQDFVFGPARIYDKDSIKFYSLNGADTIFHYYGAGPNSNPGQDSLLFVAFDYRKSEIIYVRLSDSDIDTMNLSYEIIDASPCCADYSAVVPNRFNNKPLEVITGGITILKK